MISPSWESSPGALVAFLNSGSQRVFADLVTITLLGGQVLRYCGADRPVTVNGNTFVLGPQISRSRTTLKVGIEVDMLSLTLDADESVQVNGTPLVAFATAGGLDGARVVLERGFGQEWSTGIIGTVVRFPGRVADVTATRYGVRLSVKSDLELLNVMVPANVYQPGCNNTVFDARCGLSKAAYTVAGAATSATDVRRTSFSSGLAQAAGYFDLGVVQFTSGANAGIARTVRSYAAGQFTTINPWPFAVAPGDTFSAYPGCDRTKATCQVKFNNLLRFRGQPFVPSPETVT